MGQAQDLRRREEPVGCNAAGDVGGSSNLGTGGPGQRMTLRGLDCSGAGKLPLREPDRCGRNESNYSSKVYSSRVTWMRGGEMGHFRG